MRRLDGRIAVVTAAGSGMGRASAERFASEGAHVILSDLNEAAAKEVTQAIVDAGGATAVGCDVGDLDQIKSMIAGVERDHGVLHVLAFLASDDASWVTGVALPVDGGFLAK